MARAPDVATRQVATEQRPCEGCEKPTYLRFGGRVGHFGCLQRLTAAAPAPAPAPGWDELANITRACADKLDLVLLPAQAAMVLAEWHHATGGLQWRSGWVGDMATGAYKWLRARSGADKRDLAGAEPLALDHPLMARFSLPMLLHLDWTDPDVVPEPGGWLTEYDVNGQYLAASGIDLGTGEPVHVARPRSIRPLLKLPGYLMLASAPRLDADTLPATWRAFRGLQAGRTLATTTARHLVQRGVELDVSEALVWHTHRRHLAPWYGLWRDARACLLARPGRAAEIALELVKATTNTFLGGWSRSPKNLGDLLRRDWSDQVIAEAWVRELVGLEKAAAAGWRPCGVRRDAAWFTHPGPGLPDPQPVPDSEPGKVLQLGKWKPARGRHVPVTDAIVAAHASGSPEKLVHAIVAAAKEQAA